MRLQFRRLGSLVGAALLLTACGSQPAAVASTPTTAPPPATWTAIPPPTATATTLTATPAAAPTTAPAAAPPARAAIQDKIVEPNESNYLSWTYAPDTLTIHVGDHVIWTNTGQAAHTVTADGGAFDSGSLNTRQTWTFVFNKAGTYAYHCTFHPWMKGTVTVAP